MKRVFFDTLEFLSYVIAAIILSELIDVDYAELLAAIALYCAVKANNKD